MSFHSGELFKRQSRYVNPRTISKTPITIIGLGSVGSNLADISMKAGYTKFTLCDFDVVEVHNLPNQRFKPSNVGKYKLDALSEFLKENKYQELKLTYYSDFKRIESFNKGIVFSCLDSMQARKQLFEKLKSSEDWQLFIDIRVGWFNYTLIFIHNNPDDMDRYEASMNSEVKPTGRACGMETIINGVIGSANHAVQKSLQFLRGDELPAEIFCNVENNVIINMKRGKKRI